MPHYGYHDAYDDFDFTRPWDDPSNLVLCQGTKDVFLQRLFSCPSTIRVTSIQADYFYALNGKDRWPRDFLYALNNEFTPAHVLLVECPGRGIYWSEPVEVVYQETGLNGLVDRLTECEKVHLSGFNCFLSNAAVDRLSVPSVKRVRETGIGARTPRNDDAAAKKDEERLVLRWLEILADRQRRGWHMALLLLGELGPRAKSAVPTIRELTADGDVKIRSVAAFALAKIER